ncbi:hypothetical protein DB30_03668 [Enhygromyxa salina]|uniref:Uncharacterized protein n=2 Tax=Enhygromyxa salina TaxID=215803 RepID=A0A0C2D1F7_9BACT|nr:hypothetical protein DB30_03668 [Enhygromyxa salina]
MFCCAAMFACTGGNADDADSSAAETAGDGDGDGDNTGDGDGDGDNTGDGDARPNWHEDIAPLVTEACQGCHTDGGIAPFAMQDYAQTSPWSGLMAEQAELGLMPPWHALETAQCQPPLAFKHDARLSDAQIQLLRDWVDVGSPEGDPANAAPLPSPPSLDLANPTTSVTMGSPVSIDAQGNTLDFFHCLSLDPGNDEDVYLDGIQVVPGNREIVHHVLVYVDENAASASWPGGVQQDCGGGSGVSGSQLISGWVPGGLPMEPPDGVAISLPAGARLILNVHYHATGGGPTLDDSTGLALRWTNTKPEYGSLFTLLGAPGSGSSLTGPFMIPAGATGHVEEYEWIVSANGSAFPDTIEARIWAVANHMHLVGVDMRAWIEDRDTGEETCLLHTPNWDFNWQRIYEYDAPANQGVRVKAGDIVRVQCSYDNSMNNPALASALAEAGLDSPVNVSVGEGTLDEMCLTAVGVGIKGL